MNAKWMFAHAFLSSFISMTTVLMDETKNIILPEQSGVHAFYQPPADGVHDAAAAQTVDNVGAGVPDTPAERDGPVIPQDGPPDPGAPDPGAPDPLKAEELGSLWDTSNPGRKENERVEAGLDRWFDKARLDEMVDNVGAGVHDAGQDVGPASDPTPVSHEGPAEPSAPAAVPEPDTQT